MPGTEKQDPPTSPTLDRIANAGVIVFSMLAGVACVLLVGGGAYIILFALEEDPTGTTRLRAFLALTVVGAGLGLSWYYKRV